MKTYSVETRILEEVETLPGPEGLLLYKIETQRVRGDNPSQVSTSEGINTPKAFKSYLKNGVWPARESGRFPVLLSATGIKTLREEGYPAFEDIAIEAVSKTPFTDVSYFPDAAERILLLDSSSHMAFKPDGKTPFPVAFQFYYINGRVDNQNYDLTLVQDILRARSDIKFLMGKDSPTSEIQPIPYYNRDENRTHHLPFFWRPSEADYLRMWEWCQKNGGKYPSTRKHEAVAALDLLGIECARKPAQVSDED